MEGKSKGYGYTANVGRGLRPPNFSRALAALTDDEVVPEILRARARLAGPLDREEAEQTRAWMDAVVVEAERRSLAVAEAEPDWDASTDIRYEEHLASRSFSEPICECGHVEGEHRPNGLVHPCSILGCDCSSFEPVDED